MKTPILKHLLILAAFWGTQACSSPDDTDTPPAEEKTFTIEVFYKSPTDSRTYHDTNSKLYIYYDIPSIDWIKYKYISDGVCVSRDSTVSPAQRDSVGFDGTARLHPVHADRPMAVLVESNYYPGRLALLTYEDYRETIRATVTFNP